MQVYALRSIDKSLLLMFGHYSYWMSGRTLARFVAFFRFRFGNTVFS